MKWLRICALIVLTLSAMRAVSWTLGWILYRFAGFSRRRVAVVANLVAFGAFVYFLYRSLLPGEPLDSEALLFGGIVFLSCALIDMRWLPWAPRANGNEAPARQRNARTTHQN